MLNRLVENVRWRGRTHRLLAERARRSSRPPLVVVPSCFGVRLAGGDGRAIWGDPTQLWFGKRFTDGDVAPKRALLEQFTLVPGVYGFDVYGGFMRYLEQVGGYVRGEDLFVFAYDWRARPLEAARELAAMLRALRGAGELSVDLLAFSSGGSVVRSYLAWGGGTPEAPEELPVAVRRVVYACSPQRGSLSALEYVLDGMAFLDWARRFREVGRIAGVWDLLPHPDERIFVDQGGAPIDASLYDPATWERFHMAGCDRTRLAAAEAFHRALDRAATRPHPPAWIIGCNHVPTAARAVVERGRAVIPHCLCDVDGKTYPFAYEAGDGAVPAATVAAAPGTLHGPWWTPITAHQYLGRDDGVRRLVVEALVAPERVDARGLYRLRRPDERRA